MVQYRVSFYSLAQLAYATIPLRHLDLIVEGQNEFSDLLLHLLRNVSVTFLRLNKLRLVLADLSMTIDKELLAVHITVYFFELTPPSIV